MDLVRNKTVVDNRRLPSPEFFSGGLDFDGEDLSPLGAGDEGTSLTISMTREDQQVARGLRRFDDQLSPQLLGFRRMSADEQNFSPGIRAAFGDLLNN